MRREHRVCHRATEEDYHYGIPGRFELWRCNNCGHNFQHPLPAECDLAHYYAHDYYSYQPPDVNMEPRTGDIEAYGSWPTTVVCAGGIGT